MAQHRHPELSQLDPPILDSNSAGYCRYEDTKDTEVSNILMLVSRAVVLTIVAVNGIHGSLAERSTPRRWRAPPALRSCGGSNAGMLQHRWQPIAATGLSSYNTRREACFCLNSGGTSVGA